MLKIISRLLVPSRCIICNSEGQGVCADCIEHALHARTSSCYICNSLTKEDRVCTRCQWRTPVRRAISLWRLDTTSEDLVYGLKYEGREDIARSVAHYIEKNITLPRFDVITYVPSDPKRRRERGFVAPQLIARELSRISRKPYVALLSRDKHVPQVGLGRQDRWRNVRGNFSHLNREVLVDRRILLIDDVITTGATITECAKTLKLAGSGPVYVLSVARK